VGQADEESYTIRSVCPHCNKENSHSGMQINTGIINKVSCKYCNGFYRYPIIFRKSLPHEISELMDAMCRTAVTLDRSAEIMDVCNKISSISPTYDQIWCTQVQLADVMGDPHRAVMCLEKAIMANHYAPHLFEEMDLRLARLGQFTLRDKFARKAAQLRSQGIVSSTYIEVS
jgi:transcription elongation factor Elf1